MKRLNRRINLPTPKSESDPKMFAPTLDCAGKAAQNLRVSAIGFRPTLGTGESSPTAILTSAVAVNEPLVLVTEMSIWSLGISTVLMVSWGLATLVASPMLAAYHILVPSSTSSSISFH
jgi:hypothetical protein